MLTTEIYSIDSHYWEYKKFKKVISSHYPCKDDNPSPLYEEFSNKKAISKEINYEKT
jgi:hypothetical protein